MSKNYIKNKINQIIKREGQTINNAHAHTCDHAMWSRRNFISSLGLASVGAAFAVGGNPLKALGGTSLLNMLSTLETDRKLVIIRLEGGNDGLNMVIPRFNSTYYNIRPTIAIPESGLSALDAQFGLHNAMSDLMPLWNAGDMAVVHSVGYPEANYSHFESYNIWYAGSPSDDIWETGWLGRYFEQEFPSFFDAPPLVPPALEIGNTANLMFQTKAANLALAVYDPVEFYRIAENGEVFDTFELTADCAYGTEQMFMRQLSNSCIRYAESIKNAWESSSNTAVYPDDNYLADQLAIIARMIKGHLGTKIFLVHIGGFDTHSDQEGWHDTLLNNIGSAVSAFMTDLDQDPTAKQNTLVMTISEFGRTRAENGSLGTDHATCAPMMFFGPEVIGGLKGSFASIDADDLNEYDEPIFTTDFRSMYVTVLKNWFCLDPVWVDYIFRQNFSIVPNLLPACTPSVGTNGYAVLYGHNPASSGNAIEIKYAILAKSNVRLQILNTAGQPLVTLVNEVKEPGAYKFNFNRTNHGLPAGTYVYRLEVAGKRYERKMIYPF
ncbi:MAG TPA: DUF1501 domain-containing protein [Chitinophagales bacterium]|nr:DUF1501 domain-containing protein [Chitinophagales bacterium]